jgi:hypothetical protein
MKSLIVIVMDESGSMGNKKSDVVGGFNEFLREQKELTDDIATAIFIKFNTQVIIVNESKPIMEVAELTNTTYNPGGGTALYDAIWEGVQLGEKMEPTVDRVLCLIMTDGEENSSRKITATGIRDLIKKKEDEGKWTFLYIGENPERWAKDTGISLGNVGRYDHEAPTSNFREQSRAVRSYRMESAIQRQDLLLPEPPVNPGHSGPPPPYTSK